MRFALALLGVLVFAVSAAQPSDRIEAEERRLRAEEALSRAIERDREQLARERELLLHDARMEYIGTLLGAVNANLRWNSDPGFEHRVVVAVRQRPGGEVVGVELIESSGNAEFDEAAVNAMWSSSPLPLPDHPEVFDRHIVFTFYR